LDVRQIDQQMPTSGGICTRFPDRSFFFGWRPAFSQTLNHFLDAGCFTVGPNHL
jgi:hypothetical protein